MKKLNHPLVSIIIDNWDGKHFLKECLSSVFRQSYTNFEVILIDDASKDGSADYIKNNFPKSNLIENKKHVGFAIANNQGIKKAKGKYILLLNNDTEVTSDFLYPLVELLENNLIIGAAQPKIKIIPEKDLLDDVATYLTPIGFFYHVGFFEKDQEKYNKRCLTFSPKGACFFIRKSVLDKTGLMDERFYCYFEESDLAWRIWLAGYKIIYEPKSLIYHHQAGSINKQSSANRDYFSFRNRLSSLLTNLSSPFLLLILPLHLLTIIFLMIFYAFGRKWKNIFALLKALCWNIKNTPSNLKKRLFIQKKLRVISDGNLFKQIFRIPSVKYYIKIFSAYQKGR